MVPVRPLPPRTIITAAKVATLPSLYLAS